MNDLIRSLAMLSTDEERNSGDASQVPATDFTPTRSRPMHGGAQHLYVFPNGWAASVVRHDFSYGGDAGLWELGVGTFASEAEGFKLDYSTPITDDVLGQLTDAEVSALLAQVRDLPVASA